MKIKCKSCGAKIDQLAVFPGGICINCHEKRFNDQVRCNGGILPRPDFTKAMAEKAEQFSRELKKQTL